MPHFPACLCCAEYAPLPWARRLCRWKRRWFILKADELTYHESASKKGEIKGSISLNKITQIKTVVPAQKHDFVFSLKYTTDEGAEREVLN